MELYYIIAITDHERGEAMGSLYHAAGLHQRARPSLAESQHKSCT